MNYIIYCRKSSEAEDRQVLSLDSQEKELMDIAKRYDLKVFKVFQESMSAKDVGRPIFNQMMKLISSGKADAILCWKSDRLARNFIDGGLIMDSLQKGVIKEIRTHESIHLPNESSFILAMQFGMANQYSRDLSVNVKRGNKAKLEKGGWPSMAPFGYLNDKSNQTIIIDPQYSPVIKRAFELFATGKYSVSELSNKIYDEGYRTKKAVHKIPKSMLHFFLRNPFYYGVMKKNGVYYQGNHEPLISKDLFDRVNYILDGKNKTKRKTHQFPLRGFMNCEVCGCLLTATLQKGKYVYYYCTNGKGICNQKKEHLTAQEAEELISGLLQKLKFDDQLVELAFDAYKEKFKSDYDKAERAEEMRIKALNNVEDKKNRLLDAYISGIISKEVYEAKTRDLQNEIVSLKIPVKRKDEKEIITFEQLKNAFSQAQNAENIFLKGSDEEKRQTLNNLLSNCKIKDKKIASFEFKMGYQQLAMAYPKPTNLLEMRATLDDFRTNLSLI